MVGLYLEKTRHVKNPPTSRASRRVTARVRLALTCLLMTAPSAVAADDTLATAPELHPAYCAGYYDAQEQTIGDTCIDADAVAGWENGCWETARRKSNFLGRQSIGNPRNDVARLAGYNDYQQCRSEVYTKAGVAQTLECQKRFTGKPLDACIMSGPATPTCKRLLQCDE
jgi:hypothetical protein